MDQSLVDSSPWLFAATHVLHRHLAPRHPPLALCSLGFRWCFQISTRLCYSDARARYAVLKGLARRVRRMTIAGQRRNDEGVSGSEGVRAKPARRPAAMRLPQNGTVMNRTLRHPVVPTHPRWRCLVCRGRIETVRSE